MSASPTVDVPEGSRSIREAPSAELGRCQAPRGATKTAPRWRVTARSPLARLTEQRTTLACRLKERGEERLDVIARTSGLGTTANLRPQLRRRTGLTPTEYRRRFAVGC